MRSPRSGAISTVCFRERYRPLFQEARRLLEDKAVTHIRFQNTAGLPLLEAEVSDPDSWHYQMDKARRLGLRLGGTRC